MVYITGLTPWLYTIDHFWRKYFDHKKEAETLEDIRMLYEVITEEDYQMMRRMNRDSADVFLYLAGETDLIPYCLRREHVTV